MRCSIALVVIGCVVEGSVFATEAPLNPRPAPGNARVWTDNSGRFTTTAMLVKLEGRSVTLRKAAGEIVEVPLDRLSRQDRAYLERGLARARPFQLAVRAISGLPAAFTSFLNNGLEVAKDAAERPLLLRRRAAKPILPDLSQDEIAQALPADLVYVQVSHKALASAVNRPVGRHTPVAETIVGTPVRGTALTSGATRLRLVPSRSQAVFDLVFQGQVQSQTTSFGGPVRVHSSGVTRFGALKRVVLDEQGIEVFPAQVRAQTSTAIHGVSTDLPRLRGRIARRIGSRRAMALKPAAEVESARKAELRLARELDQEVATQIQASHGKLRQLLAALPADGRRLQGALRFATSHDYLQLAVIRGSGELASELPPSPSALGTPDVAVHVHSSLVKQVLRNDQLRRSLDELASVVLAEYAQSFVGAPQQSPPLDLKQSPGGQWWSLVVRTGNADAYGSRPPPSIAGTRLR